MTKSTLDYSSSHNTIHSCKRYQFKPSLFSVIGTIFLMLIFISLGCWQLYRYEYKHTLKSKYDTALNNLPTQLSKLVSDDLHGKNIPRYTKVKIQGNYIKNKSIFLDNRTQNHRPGYEVLSLFKGHHLSKWLLINRGWVPLTRSRVNLPKLKAILGEQTIVGRIDFPSKKPFLLGAHTLESKTWPLRIQAIQIKQLSRLAKHAIYPFVILLADNQAHGFSRHWLIQTVKPEKHLGYATQWFVFALVLLIIFVALNFKKIESLNETKDRKDDSRSR